MAEGMHAPIAPTATIVEPFTAPAQAVGPMPMGPMAQDYGAAPMVARPAPARSSAPLIVGIGAILVVVCGAIGFVVFWRKQSVEADSAAPATTIEVPKKKKSDASTEDTQAKPDPKDPPPPVTPTSSPEPQPTNTVPTPKPTNTVPTPKPTNTVPTPKPTNTVPTPKPTDVPPVPPPHRRIPR